MTLFGKMIQHSPRRLQENSKILRVSSTTGLLFFFSPFRCLKNVAPWDSLGAMVPAMFSTSVLERRKSLDPEMVRQLEVSEGGIFVDKENRPPKAGNGAIKEAVKVKVGGWLWIGWVVCPVFFEPLGLFSWGYCYACCAYHIFRTHLIWRVGW